MRRFPATHGPARIHGLEVSREDPTLRMRFAILTLAFTGFFAAGLALGALGSSWIAQRAEVSSVNSQLERVLP